MGTTSWTGYGDTAYVKMASPTDITVNNSTFLITMPSIQLAANGPYMESSFKYVYVLGASIYLGNTRILQNGASTSTWTKKDIYVSAAWNTPTTTQNTADFFNIDNPNDRTVVLDIKHLSPVLNYSDDHQGSGSIPSSSAKTFGAINLYLDVPPTATVSAVSYDKGYIYAGLTTASVTISDVAAYYGGSVTDVTFRIGQQTDSISGNGTLSIALDTAGTFTPTVTVTDSRGQTQTYSLSPITVLTYSAPTVTFTAERTNSSGKPDDEGTYATCPSMFVFADAIATAIAPSVVLTDENGTQTTPTVTWYTTRAADGTLSGTVNWASLSAGDTVYGLIPGLNTNYSYQISIRPRDSEGTGMAIIQTVASAFYTIDFLAGGHGIAFGKPASSTGFECAMDVTFDDDVLIDLPYYNTVGFVDKAIYDAVVVLGWDSEVLV